MLSKEPARSSNHHYNTSVKHATARATTSSFGSSDLGDLDIEFSNDSIQPPGSNALRGANPAKDSSLQTAHNQAMSKIPGRPPLPPGTANSQQNSNRPANNLAAASPKLTRPGQPEIPAETRQTPMRSESSFSISDISGVSGSIDIEFSEPTLTNSSKANAKPAAPVGYQRAMKQPEQHAGSFEVDDGSSASLSIEFSNISDLQSVSQVNISSQAPAQVQVMSLTGKPRLSRITTMEGKQPVKEDSFSIEFSDISNSISIESGDTATSRKTAQKPANNPPAKANVVEKQQPLQAVSLAAVGSFKKSASRNTETNTHSSDATPSFTASSQSGSANSRSRSPVSESERSASSHSASSDGDGPTYRLGNMADLMEMLGNDSIPEAASQGASNPAQSVQLAGTGSSLGRPARIQSTRSVSGSSVFSDVPAQMTRVISTCHTLPHTARDGDQTYSATSTITQSRTKSRSSSTTSSSTNSSDFRPRVMTMDQLETASLGEHEAESSHNSRNYSGDSVSSNGRTRSTRQNSASRSSISGSRRLQQMNDPSAAGLYQSMASEDSEDLLAGLTMVKERGSSSSIESGSISHNHSDSGVAGQSWPHTNLETIREVDTSHYHSSHGHEGSVGSSHEDTDYSSIQESVQASTRTSRRSSRSSQNRRRSSLQSQQQQITEKQQAAAEASKCMSASSEHLLPYGAIQPHWTTSTVQQHGKQQQQYHPKEERYSPHAGVRVPTPLPAVFGLQKAIQGQGHEIDLTPLGPSRTGVRSVALQVGSMNEVSTQVSYDPVRRMLVDDPNNPHHYLQQPQHTPLPVNSGPCNSHHLHNMPAGMIQSVQQQLVHAGPWQLPNLYNAGTVSQPVGLNPQAGVLPGGWGMLSTAVQNLKAAALLEQLEKASWQIKGLADVAASTVGQHTARTEGAVDAIVQKCLTNEQAKAATVPTSSTVVGQLPMQQQQQQCISKTLQNEHASYADLKKEYDTNSSASVSAVVGDDLLNNADNEHDSHRDANQHASHTDSESVSDHCKTDADSVYSQSFETLTASAAPQSPQNPSLASPRAWQSMQCKDATHNSNHAISKRFKQGASLGNKAGLHLQLSFGGKRLSTSYSEVFDAESPVGAGAGITGISHRISRRRSSAADGLIIPDFNHMAVLPKPSIPKPSTNDGLGTRNDSGVNASESTTKAQVGTTLPSSEVEQTSQVNNKLEASQESCKSAGNQHQKDVCLQGGQVQTNPQGHGISISTEANVYSKCDSPSAAKDTLLRYHALLSSGAIPGGLLDPGSLARMRSELLASAAVSAASCGVGYTDAVKEFSATTNFRSQLQKLQAQLLNVKHSSTVSSPSALGSTGYMHGQSHSQAVRQHGTSLSQDRVVMLDKNNHRLEDIGSKGMYKYTTLADTMKFICAYRPAHLAC